MPAAKRCRFIESECAVSKRSDPDEEEDSLLDENDDWLASDDDGELGEDETSGDEEEDEEEEEEEEEKTENNDKEKTEDDDNACATPAPLFDEDDDAIERCVELARRCSRTPLKGGCVDTDDEDEIMARRWKRRCLRGSNGRRRLVRLACDDDHDNDEDFLC